MGKTLTKAVQILQRINKRADMQRDWKTRKFARREHDSQLAVLAGILGKDTLEMKKEQPKYKKDMRVTQDEELLVQGPTREDSGEEGRRLESTK